jgi:hypothetical protein
VAGNPESHLERTLNEPDNLESSEILFLQADSLAMALRGLAATNEPTVSTDEYDERQAAAAVIVTDTKIFFDDLKHSDFRCMYRAGASPVNAHLLRRLGSERALFESALVEPESWFELDYAESRHGWRPSAIRRLDQVGAGVLRPPAVYVISQRRQLGARLQAPALNGVSISRRR